MSDVIEILQQLAENAGESERNSPSDLRAMYHMGKKEAFLTAIEVIANPADFT